MQDKIDQLIEELIAKNDLLSVARARVWIELLWSDFESSYAKAGYEYKGSEVTEKVIRQWIDSYGDKIHEFAGNNPKYVHLLKEDDDTIQ
ncbi:MAG: YfhJ family protein [Paenisporosarcina sp.]